MKLKPKYVDILMLIIALGWLIGMGMTYMGHGYEAMYVTIPIISAHFIIGLSSNGTVDKKMFVYPFLCWLITFTIGIIGMQYFTPDDLNDVPRLILGMHPSLFFELVFYWLSGIATISVGLYVNRERWLSKEKWENFLNEVACYREAGYEED